MTILGRHDLVPRRPARRPLRPVLVGVAVAALAAGGVVGWRMSGGRAPAAACRVVTVRAAAPPVAAANDRVTLVVLNGTTREHLAARVRALLLRRGFRVLRIGNGAPNPGLPLIGYGPGGLPSARLLAEQLPDAELVPAAGDGPLVLLLGTRFRGLSSPAQAAAAHARDLAAAAVAPLATGACPPGPNAAGPFRPAR